MSQIVYLSVAQAAAQCSCSARLVQQWCEAGRIGAVRLGRAWLIPVGFKRPDLLPRGRKPTNLRQVP